MKVAQLKQFIQGIEDIYTNGLGQIFIPIRIVAAETGLPYHVVCGMINNSQKTRNDYFTTGNFISRY